MRLETKLAALEMRLRPGSPPPWATVLVDEMAGETRKAATARHFGSAGAAPDARLIVVIIQEAAADREDRA